jgi:hypothetical protein
VRWRLPQKGAADCGGSSRRRAAVRGINSLFHHGGPWGGGGGFLPTAGAPTLVEETVINEYGGGAQPEALADVTDLGQVSPANDSDPGAPSPASDDFAAPTTATSSDRRAAVRISDRRSSRL